MFTFNDFRSAALDALAANGSVNWHDLLALVPENLRGNVFGWANNMRLAGEITIRVEDDTVRGRGKMPVIYPAR